MISKQTFKQSLTLLFFFGGAVSVSSVPAQTASVRIEPSAQLSKPIQLMLGQTTLQKLTAELSRQTGLVIEVTGYLQNRRVIAQMPRTTAKETLDAITEMYGWRWFSPVLGHYRIARRRLPAMDNAAQVAQAITQQLPIDLRQFLYAEAALPHNDYAESERQLPYYAASLRKRQQSQKFQECLQQDIDSFFASCKPLLFENDQPTDRKLYVSQMTGEQRRRLLLILTMQALNANPALMRGELTPYQRDPLNAFIEVSGEMMTISSFDPVNGGASVSTRIRQPHKDSAP